MTERIDHAAAAMSALKECDATLDGMHKLTAECCATLLTAQAQVHATLALVEQQRIANLVRMYDPRFPDSFPSESEWSSIQAEIKTRLGLTGELGAKVEPEDVEWEYADADRNGRIMSLNESMAFMGPPKKMRRRPAGEWEEVPS